MHTGYLRPAEAKKSRLVRRALQDTSFICIALNTILFEEKKYHITILLVQKDPKSGAT